MKSKYLAIIASLIILMFSLSVVSAAVANGENNDVFSVDDNQSISQSSVSILNNDSDKLDEISSLKSGNGSNDSGKIKAVIKASYKNKKIYVTVVDKNNKPLKNVNVHLEMHASYTRGLVKIVDAKTNAKGDVYFDVSGLKKAGTYYVWIGTLDDKYSIDLKDFEYTIKKQSKMGDTYPDTHKSNKDKINNKQNNTNDVNMRNTGIPILGLLLVLFAIFGVSYRKD